MSGYASADSDAEHAMVLNENALHAVRQMIPSGNFRFQFCQDCGEEIPKKRREVIPGVMHCVDCSPFHMTKQRVRMLDHIL